MVHPVQTQVSRSRTVREARARRALIARLAREDVNVFAEFVMRDELTNKPITQAGPHVAWHRLADQHARILLWSHVEAGKTQQLSILRTLWQLGRNPELRFLLLSNTKNQATKIADVLRQYVEQSAELHDVFPDLQPGEPWGTNAFSVKRATMSKDYSVQTSGVHGNIQGARLDRAILDDVLDYENTLTEDARKGLIDWYLSAVAGRYVEGCRVIGVGTAFHPKDILHFLARNGFAAFKYPVVDADGNPRWPERWPLERIAARAQELGPVEAARQLMCEARDDSTARFKREWIEVGLRLGDGTSLCGALNALPPGYRTFTGVDLAVQQKDSSDSTCLFTIAVDRVGVRTVLSIETGKWSGPEIVRKIYDHHARYQSICVVENNASQQFIVQFARAGSPVPIIPFTTGRNKAHPEFGVESMAAEMAGGKWRIPNQGGRMHPEVSSWVDEMLFYNPKAHTGDRLMACIAPGYLVTTSRGLVPIEEVQTGDVVLTHRSRWRQVIGTTSRHWSGQAISLKPRGLAPIVMTPEHPVWSAEAWFDRTNKCNRLIPLSNTWEFRDAADLKSGRKDAGDFILAPAAEWPAQPPEVDAGLAFLAGLYLAEGWVSDHQASFAFHRREMYLVELVRREARRLWGANTSAYTREGHGGVTATIQSTEATRFFSRFGKRDFKCLPWEWMSLPKDIGSLIVRGWLVGDGARSVNKYGVKRLKAVSVSRYLIYQMQQFLWRLGLLPSTCPFNNQATFRGKPCNKLPAQQLSLSSTDSGSLLANMLPEEKERWGSDWGTRTRTNSASVPIDGGVAIKLGSADRFDYDGMIHNLHVEEDESFVVGGIAVHNSWFSREGVRLGSRAVEAVTSIDLSRR